MGWKENNENGRRKRRNIFENNYEDDIFEKEKVDYGKEKEENHEKNEGESLHFEKIREDIVQCTKQKGLIGMIMKPRE